MSKRMLIDASHPEETRVVVLDGQKVEEFDFEAASRRPLKGNIYLAKVTRVEPSLQAAFVEYGGNRQGFLAFSEIHPDYYQIPVADRMALIAEAEAEARRRQEDDVESFEITSGPKPPSPTEDEEDAEDLGNDNIEGEETDASALESVASERDRESAHDEDVFSNHPEDDLAGAAPFADDAPQPEEDASEPVPPPSTDEGSDAEVVDQQAAASAAIEDRGEEVELPQSELTTSVPDPQAAAEPLEETSATRSLSSPRPPQRWMRRRHYKIQEVIKRHQVILVQVVKEERGNKGAALTTYLSLAGRYCVLMPNTPRGGGISRKITNLNDRKRLKSAAQQLELPEGMGLIIRTAGENRTKVEIRRDYEYLLRLWDTIRELTLKSNAPACVYEEGDLIKRVIRDLYNKDVGEVLVEGDEGYRNAKDFMRMLMPSHAKNVKLYKEPVPLFQRHHIEAQLDAMFLPTVTLRSGGYIVINQTEALVSIDVNSGRATREHSIEETAHKTNLEAADEIGRQLRLRDLAGLIVIDFIDMEDQRNDRDVERRLRDAVKNDRARVQIGKISQFGLLEMSRQRLRAGVIAGSTVPCPHCAGQGIIRSVESTALRVLRALEEEGQKLRASSVSVRVAADVAIYSLNQKRKELARIESDYGMTISFDPRDGMPAGTFDLERTAQKTEEERARHAVSIEAGFAEMPDAGEEATTESEVEDEIEQQEEREDEEILVSRNAENRPADGQGGRRRRRRRRGGRDRRGPDRAWEAGDQRHPEMPARGQAPEAPAEGTGGSTSEAAGISEASMAVQQREHAHPGQPGDPGLRRRRRRRRRGRRGQGGQDHVSGGSPSTTPEQGSWTSRFGSDDEIDTTPRAEPLPNASSGPEWSRETPRERATVSDPIVSPPASHPTDTTAHTEREEKPAEPAKRGWWQRTFKSDS